MPKSTEKVIRVNAPHYVAGLIIEDGLCTEAAPILRWAIGKKEKELITYFDRKGFETERVNNGS